MNKRLHNYLLSGHTFNNNEKLLAFQFQFFNIMLALAIVFSPFIALIHSHISMTLFYSDMTFSITSLILMLIIRYKKINFELATLLFIPSLYVTITLVFYLAGDDPTKVIWAPIFFACAFLLRGTYSGLFWLGAILASYFLGYLAVGEEGVFYSAEELALISIAFITVSLIFNAFRQKNDLDNTSLMQANASLADKSQQLEVFNQDLEERIAMALLESQHKTKSIQHNLDIINKHVITSHIDLNGIITNVSAAYCKISGHGKQHFISKPFTLLFDPETPVEELKQIWEDLKSQKTFSGEVKNRDSAEKLYWLKMSISAEYTANNEHIGYICISHDISDKKLVLQQQEQLIAQSRHAAMGEMISMIAHQWRQPLSTIATISSSISLEISLDNFSKEHADEQMQKITKQVQHLSHTIDDFRDFFKPGKGEENTKVHKLVQEAVQLLDHRLNKGINLVYKMKTDTCLALYRKELVQVLINVLNNACDALTEKKIKDPTITINEYIEDENVIIEINDNAGGIDEKALPHIFDPYFSTKTKNGTGLGLYMSKTIVEDHQKGSLEAFNRNQGALFKLSIPLSTCKI